jgi:hypothetical protein
MDTCNVYERVDYVKDNGSTGQKMELVTADMPCRISYSSISANSETDKAAYKSQGVKLFFSPSRDIKPGSMVEVTREDTTTKYRASGEPAIYPAHKEIELELWEVRA